MSAEAPATSAPVEAAVASAAVELKPKNTHRLNRILRKPKASLPPRKWHVEEDGATRTVGVPASVVRKLVEGLTEEERQRAAAGLDPLSATQEALVRRAARFGLNINSNVAAAPALPAPTFVVDAETLRRREERFKQAAPAPQ
ncbi:hypothetical protein ABB37_08535 [Leptomonas pyrrhocoris]|uniref:Uncharacterized protein n=1 Tax=Leptomonas pyrrhocoris TaxID=157538 RepID=A0A0M9FSK0_LEPPY|nr:hypothetical protein ABB37_08535 [Leptomonas pyrrhocoris]KPA75220.1 hypothetical protein ABB37_08535 [Leptomonas pyrrhocoris]|eukprot:XP_015653659.1 hypothetical protein ABB37_08535 [Leptomonas pyrrhocoris]